MTKLFTIALNPLEDDQKNGILGFQMKSVQGPPAWAAHQAASLLECLALGGNWEVWKR